MEHPTDTINGWNIPGGNPLAQRLRAAAAYHAAETPITIATEGRTDDADAFALGPALLASANERVAPYYAAFEAIDAVKHAIDSGEIGRIYGCFASFRIPRGVSSDEVRYNALLPITGLTLDLIADPIRRAWATRASLAADGDAWFVHLRTTGDILITIEAMAVTDPSAGRELLVEVTGSERVLRAEPMRQSVTVERVAAAPVAHGWWEDMDERYLQLVRYRATLPHGSAGTRVRAVWDAIERSVETGEPVAVP